MKDKTNEQLINIARHDVCCRDEALEEIQRRLEVGRTADGARRLHVDVSIPNQVHQEEQARALLEIGFDLGVESGMHESDCGLSDRDRIVNPFRRESTKIQKHCFKCKHTVAADGACHSIGCECSCNDVWRAKS